MRALLWAIGLGEYHVKKSLTSGRIEERHAVITQVHQALPERSISRLCDHLQVSRSWYYEKQTRLEEDEVDVELRDSIERIILDFPGYGYRRVTHALKRAGWIVNHKQVLRIMREESLLCRLKRHLVHTTDSQHPYPVYPNLIKGMTISDRVVENRAEASKMSRRSLANLHSICYTPPQDMEIRPVGFPRERLIPLKKKSR